VLKIEYSKKAVKTIGKISNPFKQNIKEAIEKLPAGDVKKLQGHTSYLTEHTRNKSGETEGSGFVKDKIANNGILIENIGPRGQIYKGV